MQTPRVRLGELLVRAGLITAEQLDEALAEQRRNGKRLGTVLVESGLVSETQVTQILSQQLSVPWVSLHHIDFSRQLLNLVPLDVVERYCLIPIYIRRVRGLGDALYVAMDDPTNAQALEEVAERSGLHVRAMIAPPADIRAAIRECYGVGEPEEPRVSPPPPPAPPEDEDDDEERDVPTGIHRRIELPADRAAAVPPPASDDAASAAAAPAREAPAAVTDAAAARDDSRSASSPVAAPEPPPRSNAPSRPGGSSPLAAPPPSSPLAASKDGVPPSSDGRRAAVKPGRKMIALTLLDGTTIKVPAKPKSAPNHAQPEEPAAPPAAAGSEEQLTARDLVAALRAASHGADASEILGENVRWEAMLAALLSVLLKKHLIADWEFVEEFKKS